jgi:ankyrin repeat protein
LLKVATLDINAADRDGRTALIDARDEEVALLLLAAPGIDPAARDRYGNTALHVACHHNWPRAVSRILECPEVDVNVRSTHGTPLMLSSTQEIALRVLADERVNVNVRNDTHGAFLHQASAKGWERAVARLLEFPDIDVNAYNMKNETPLIHAATQEIAIRLLDHPRIEPHTEGCPSIDTNRRRNDGETVLQRAAQNGWSTVVNRILQHRGASVYGLNNNGALRAFFATKTEDIALSLLTVLEVRISNRTIVLKRRNRWLDHEGTMPATYFLRYGGTVPDTLLTKAIREGWESVVDRLIQIPGIEVNALECENDLHPFFLARTQRMALRLLTHPDITIKEMQRMLEFAAQHGWTSVLQRLKDLAQLANHEFDDSDVASALLAALSYRGDLEVENVRLLLSIPWTDHDTKATGLCDKIRGRVLRALRMRCDWSGEESERPQNLVAIERLFLFSPVIWDSDVPI